jgi:hypothetical protein
MLDPEATPAVVISQSVSSVIDEVPLLGSRCAPICQTAKDCSIRVASSGACHGSSAFTSGETCLFKHIFMRKLLSGSNTSAEHANMLCKRLVCSEFQFTRPALQPACIVR